LWGTCLAAIFSVHGELAFPIGFHAASDFSVFHGISFDPHAHCLVLLRTPATLPINYQFWYVVLMLAVMLWLAISTSKPGYRSPLGQYRALRGDAPKKSFAPNNRPDSQSSASPGATLPDSRETP
ncbi:MAG TPA: hypothetical protein VKY92_04690, partial [Verrucomicrobiae bacterium]|nr:hypothetical protein [Verrucomicrobiae bacterium]